MINQLTFTRFIAAFIIVIYHYGQNLFKSIINIPIINEQLWFHLNLGVSFFFTLSGFVMTIAYKQVSNIDKKTFFINRFSRIYPLHLLTLFSIIIIQLLFSINYLEYYHFPTRNFLEHLFLIQAWFPGSSLSLNVPSWSISVEMFFYLLFPFIISRLRKIHIIKSSIFIILFFIISQLAFNSFFYSPNYGGYNSLDRYFLSYNPLFHLSSFMIGILAGLIYINKIIKDKNYDFYILFIFSITILMIYLLKDLFLHNGLLSINFSIIILLLSLNNGKITKYFSHPKLIYLGNISFALYLLQYSVFLVFMKIFSFFNINNEWITFIIPLICLIILSHIVYKYFEIPVQNYIKRKFINTKKPLI